MITFLVSLLSTSGFGAIIGWIGGLTNRWMDYKTKTLDIQMQQNQFAHEQSMRDKDLEALQVEVNGKMEIASLEAATKSEEAGFDALKASYAHDSSFGSGRIDGFRKLVRPIITAAFMALILYINYCVWYKLDSVSTLTREDIMEIIRWTLFEASVVIGWWFAQRPSEQSGLRVGGAPKKPSE